MLLEASFLARLERARLIVRRAFEAGAAGQRRSRAFGASVEFADHREYLPGDDPRTLDWNAYARLERLFVKLYHQESDAAVHLLLDASASMGFGEPPKHRLSRQLAAGLAYAGLSNLDQAGLLAFGGSAAAVWRPSRGKGRIRDLLERLDALEAGGRADPVETFRRYAAGLKRPGLSIILSDFLDPRFPDAVGRLLHHRHEVWCVQILAPEDLGEGLAGDLELVDSETGERREVTATPAVLTEYRAGVEAFRCGLRKFCLSRGVGFVTLDSKVEFDETLLGSLRAAGLLQ